jgi:hypothetical protein
MMMMEWRVDYSIVRGDAQGGAGRILAVGADERQACEAATEAASDFHDEIEIRGAQPL